MRVLLISHTCQSASEGQPKADRLARIPGVELRVLVPDRWLHYGSWRPAHVPEGGSFTCEVGQVAWPWVGPAQCYLHWYPRLGELLRTFRPDIIDLWEEPWGLVSAHACLLRDRLLPGAKIVSETEQNIDKRLPAPFEQFRTYTLRHADFAVGRNSEALDLLRAKGYRGPAEVVPNAVDAQLFRPLDKVTARRSLEMNGFVAGYVGRLVEEKGLMDLVNALAYCPDNVHLLFVGSGPMREKLEHRASGMNRANQVRFLPALPLEKLPSVMNALDVLVLPSRTTPSWKEQFGRVIIEAHACGIPVIGSDSGAIPEVVGQAGHVVPERSPREIGRAIRQLTLNPDQCARLGALGRVQVEAHFTWERVAERMHSIYQRLLQDTARNAAPEVPLQGAAEAPMTHMAAWNPRPGVMPPPYR